MPSIEMMTSFVEKHCGSSLTSWLIVDTLLISKLFTPFVPIHSQFRLYTCHLGEFTDFSAFFRMMSLLKGSTVLHVRWVLLFFFSRWNWRKWKMSRMRIKTRTRKVTCFKSSMSCSLAFQQAHHLSANTLTYLLCCMFLLSLVAVFVETVNVQK